MQNRYDLGKITAVEIAAAIGLPASRLFEIADQIERYYHPPRLSVTGPDKTRELDVPKPFLRRILKKLHRFLQRKKFFSSAAHGGVKGRSCFTSARQHLGTHAVAIRDVTNCYPSVSKDRLSEKLKGYGFRMDAARLLSCLLTCRGQIPQGASTSGDALNLFLWELDIQVLAFCENDVNYSRVADDHVVSGENTQRVEAVAGFVEERLRSEGLAVNERKKQQNGMTQSPGLQRVHSIGVNHPTKTRIPRDRHKEYIIFAEKYVRSARSVSADTLPHVAAMRRKLMGYVNYSKQADLSPARNLKRLLESGDLLVTYRLRKAAVTRSRKWWVCNAKIDRSIQFAHLWKRKLEEVSVTDSTIVESRAVERIARTLSPRKRSKESIQSGVREFNFASVTMELLPVNTDERSLNR